MDVDRPDRGGSEDEGSSVPELAEALVSALPSWQLAVFRLNDRVASSLGIAASDLQCLFVLDRRGTSSPTEIAGLVDLSTGAASRMVDRLLRAGMVTRKHHEGDRRRVEVAITATARRALHDLYDPLDEQLRTQLQTMGAGTLQQLLAFVRDAQQHTEAGIEQLGGAGAPPGAPPS